VGAYTSGRNSVRLPKAQVVTASLSFLIVFRACVASSPFRGRRCPDALAINTAQDLISKIPARSSHAFLALQADMRPRS
jgi:hypothetical protein